jgi:hypothetical protein
MSHRNIAGDRGEGPACPSGFGSSEDNRAVRSMLREDRSIGR